MDYFKSICEIQKIAWRDDDCMNQDTLFELQDKIAQLALRIASAEHKVDDLVSAFPWIYTVGGQ